MSGKLLRRILLAVILAAPFLLAQCRFDPGAGSQDGARPGVLQSLNADNKVEESSPFVVLAYNDLGMHCMNQDFSEFMILPPYNTLHAQVIRTDGDKPQVVTGGVSVDYYFPNNTSSSNKTNFWDYCQSLLGVCLEPDVGLTGNGLSGAMSPSGSGDWLVTGIPLTPVRDDGLLDPFQLASVVVRGEGGVELARTQAVTPVSWELRCVLCHQGDDAPASVLDAHDRLHGTSLYQPGAQSPVLCGGCHAQVELGIPGSQPGCTSLSQAMHKAHAPRMMDTVEATPKGVVCYACHPGTSQECLRDTHARRQMNCSDCHSGGTKDWEAAMLAVADPGRQPWVSEPRCGTCHKQPGYEFEQEGVLYRNSKGHGGLYCEACHNSTHAITPAMDEADNVQSVTLQHHAGAIRKCTICHEEQPSGGFTHRLPSWL